VNEYEESLAAMRGLVFGILFGVLIWAAILIPTFAIGYGIAWVVTK
jgi:uncharacterized membrane protein